MSVFVAVASSLMFVFFPLQRRGGQAAQLRHQEVCKSAAHQERQEDHRLRPQRRLPQLHRGKRAAADGRRFDFA